jgi:hypothetical protein
VIPALQVIDPAVRHIEVLVIVVALTSTARGAETWPPGRSLRYDGRGGAANMREQRRDMAGGCWDDFVHCRWVPPSLPRSSASHASARTTTTCSPREGEPERQRFRCAVRCQSRVRQARLANEEYVPVHQLARRATAPRPAISGLPSSVASRSLKPHNSPGIQRVYSCVKRTTHHLS